MQRRDAASIPVLFLAAWIAAPRCRLSSFSPQSYFYRAWTRLKAVTAGSLRPSKVQRNFYTVWIFLHLYPVPRRQPRVLAISCVLLTKALCRESTCFSPPAWGFFPCSLHQRTRDGNNIVFVLSLLQSEDAFGMSVRLVVSPYEQVG